MTDNLMPIEEARKIKAERAAAINLLESGDLKLVEVLRRPPRPLYGCTVWELMTSSKGFGPQGAKKTLEAAVIWPMLELGELSKGQRTRIIENLPPRMKD